MDSSTEAPPPDAKKGTTKQQAAAKQVNENSTTSVQTIMAATGSKYGAAEITIAIADFQVWYVNIRTYCTALIAYLLVGMFIGGVVVRAEMGKEFPRMPEAASEIGVALIFGALGMLASWLVHYRLRTCKNDDEPQFNGKLCFADPDCTDMAPESMPRVETCRRRPTYNWFAWLFRRILPYLLLFSGIICCIVGALTPKNKNVPEPDWFFTSTAFFSGGFLASYLVS